MADSRRASFRDMVEIVQFDAEESNGNRQSKSLCVATAGARALKRQSSPAPARTGWAGFASTTLPLQAPATRTASCASSSNECSLLAAGCSPSSSMSTAAGDSDAEEAAQENVFAKAAERRRIRRSVTANHGPGLSPHALPAMTMSRILTRRRGGSADFGIADISSGPADDSIDRLSERVPAF
ncbi:unnamed protein product [Prorocentrum cordatum]|uniref:Uncharacterized protein n=1 Tax=Prorocentrum cordatum TaxID=2364126 RepID=A0ABN9Q1S6_9DINO|nr:unnamed protein product [Polarella glacialis]